MTVVADPISVVIVDDTPDIRLLIRLRLELDGRFNVIAEVGDGAEAVSAVTSYHPDAVVLDLAMPSMDGLEAIPEIKRASPDTKILVFSGFDGARMSVEAMSRGADGYLEKGSSMDEVTSHLAGLAGRPGHATPRLRPRRSTSTEDLPALSAEALAPSLRVLRELADTLVTSAHELDHATLVEVADAIARRAGALADLAAGTTIDISPYTRSARVAERQTRRS